MRALSVVGTLEPKSGGPAEALRIMLPEFERLGWAHHVVSCDPPDKLRAIAATMEAYTFDENVFGLGPGRGTFLFSSHFRDWLNAHVCEYDVVLIHGLWTYIAVAASNAAKASAVPYWVFAHGMLDPYFNQISYLKALKKRVYWIWQHQILKSAVAVIFTAEDEKLLARTSFSPYQVREQVISLAAKRPPENAQQQLDTFFGRFPVLRQNNYLLFLGRLHPKKGCDLLIQAFGRIQKSEGSGMLVMAGPGDPGYVTRLKGMAEEAGVSDRIVWTGMLGETDKYGAIRGAEAFILPSHQENFGIAVAEALSCGVPTLITKKINIWREISDLGAGLVEADTLEGTETMLRNWLALSPDEKEKMAINAKACYEKNFTVEGCVAEFIQMFERAVTASPTQQK